MRRAFPPLLIALLALAFFADLAAHPTEVLYAERSDLLAMHLPMKQFLVRSYQETGEIPLWNPYVSGGMPFAQDVQVAAFYPLHAPLYLLPAWAIGPVMSWLVVLHVMIAGWCMYAYARTQDLEPLGALAAAIGYMFAGKWLLHIVAGGHYPMLGLAWVPLVLLFLEQAIRRNSLWRASLAGCAFGLMLLGSHPQVTFYAGLFVGIWTLGPALEVAGWTCGEQRLTLLRLGWPLLRWIGYGAWTVLVAVLLGAIQLLPNLEMIPHATRSGGMPSLESWQVAFWKLTELVGPPPVRAEWENRGGLGLLWIVVAAMGLTVGGSRTRYQGIVLLLLIAFGLGGSVVFEGLPGFRYFRLPARMLWFAAVPISLMAATTVQYIARGMFDSSTTARRWRIVIPMTATGCLLLGGLSWLVQTQRGCEISTAAQAYWAGSLALVLLLWPAASGLLRGHGWVPLLLTCALAVDAWLLAWPLVDTRPEASVYPQSAAVHYLASQQGEHGRVLDRDLPGLPGNTPLGFTLPMHVGIEPVRGWHSLDIGRYKEYVQFIADEDAPAAAGDLIPNFPIHNRQLLDLLGVRYLLQPRSPEGMPADATPASADSTWKHVLTDVEGKSFGVIRSRGLKRYPPYDLYENTQAFPRAFVVHRAEPLPDRGEVLDVLKAANLRETVFLEGEFSAMATTLGDAAVPGSARIVERTPNRLVVECDLPTRGFLVITDPWYPGWSVAIDGRPAPLHRANYAFRAVEVPQGQHQVLVQFTPATYAWGKAISGIAVLLIIGQALLVVCLAAPLPRRSLLRCGSVSDSARPGGDAELASASSRSSIPVAVAPQVSPPAS